MQPAVLSALKAQFAAIFIVFLIGQSGILPPLDLLALAALQGLIAGFAAVLLRAPRWWLPLHLVFLPMVVCALQWHLPTWVYAVSFLALWGVYWSTFRTQVPLFLSNRITVHRLCCAQPDERPLKVLDVGSGIGSFIVRLGQLRPDWHVSGIELAPLPYLLARWRCRPLANVSALRGDYWQLSLGDYDLVYAFLSPVPMRELWRKARREMKPGSLLISNSFPIPDLQPESMIAVDDARSTTLYCYRIPGGAAAAAPRQNALSDAAHGG